MKHKIEKLVDKIYQLEENPQYSKEIYLFGVEQGIMILLNIILSLVIGYLIGNLKGCVLFSLCYFSLRRYSGGYHAKKAKCCLILSMLLLVMNLIFIKYCKVSVAIIIIYMMANIVIFKFSPIEALNKPLDKIEKIIYRKRARMLLLIYLCVVIIMRVIWKKWLLYLIAAVISDATLMGIAIYIKSDF